MVIITTTCCGRRISTEASSLPGREAWGREAAALAALPPGDFGPYGPAFACPGCGAPCVMARVPDERVVIGEAGDCASWSAVQLRGEPAGRSWWVVGYDVRLPSGERQFTAEEFGDRAAAAGRLDQVLHSSGVLSPALYSPVLRAGWDDGPHRTCGRPECAAGNRCAG